MACSDCCRCCHQPPDGTTPHQARLTRDLARIAGVTPFYTRWGKYRPHAYATGADRSIKTPSGSSVKADVWNEPLTFDGSNRMVNFDASLTAEDALAVFKALWVQKAKQKRRARREGRKR